MRGEKLISHAHRQIDEMYTHMYAKYRKLLLIIPRQYVKIQNKENINMSHTRPHFLQIRERNIYFHYNCVASHICQHTELRQNDIEMYLHLPTYLPICLSVCEIACVTAFLTPHNAVYLVLPYSKYSVCTVSRWFLCECGKFLCFKNFSVASYNGKIYRLYTVSCQFTREPHRWARTTDTHAVHNVYSCVYNW